MYNWKEDLSNRQSNVSRGRNTTEYIVLHHTWVIWKWNIPTLLWETKAEVSCHFFIDQKWDAYKLGDPKWILWHCWESEWEWKNNMNQYSLGIEVEWPEFTKAQRAELRRLVQYLMFTFHIPKERVIKHKDIAPWRKVDPDDSLFGLSGFRLWRSILAPKDIK